MNVLLVKMSSLGDIVHTLPAVADAAHRGIRFDWVVEETYQSLPARASGVDSVLPVALRRWRSAPLKHRLEIRRFHRRLRRRRYDVVLDAQGLIKSAVVGLCARGHARAGFDFASVRERPAALTYERRLAVPRRDHAINRSRRLFAAALGYQMPSSEPAFGMAASRPSGGHVVLAHGATWANKLWPDAFWSDIAQRIAAIGLKPLLPWLGDERERALRIAATVAGAEVLPRTDVAGVFQLISNASAVVGVDSGLGHLAAALGRPTVMLFGPTDVALTGCHGPYARNLAASMPCRPCYSRRCRYHGEPILRQGRAQSPACLAAVPPSRVWDALTQMMRREQMAHGFKHAEANQQTSLLASSTLSAL